MSYKVPVDQCQPAIANALVDILTNMPSKHRLDVIDYFEKAHNVQIHLEKSYTWSLVEFRSQEHFMEWYLKWA